MKECTCTPDPGDMACESCLELHNLELEIEHHDNAFWVDNDPEITDEEYDAIVAKLPENHSLRNKVHPATTTKRAKVKHIVPMLSLKKVQSIVDLLVWAKSVARNPQEKFIWTSKKDGLSGEWDGKRLVTRGDGEFGFDITDRVPYIKGLQVGRGEILVTKSDFAAQSPSRSDGTPYKTERSAAAGLVNNEGSITTQTLTFVPFDIDMKVFTLDDLRYVDFPTLIEDVRKSDYPTDGAVLSLYDSDYGRSLGLTSHHPRHSIALKFGNESATTKLISVTWSPGKRKLTPTANLEPVEIEGFTNSRASLHNVDQIARLGVRVGDVVEVQRCNSIIPQIVRVVKKARNRKPILCESCPGCGGVVVYSKPDLICENPNCGGTKAKLLHDAITRLGIENIGPATVSSMVRQGYYTILNVLSMVAEDFMKLPGFATRSANQAAAEIERVRSSPVSDYKILAALNIPGVGLTISKRIMAVRNLAELRNMSIGELAELPGVGKTHATDIFEAMLSTFSLTRMLQLLVVEETKGLAARKIVVFTGKSDVKRDDWIKLAEGAVFAFGKSVTKKTALVVTNNVESTSTKAAKARKYGIEIITYDEFKVICDGKAN